MNIPVNEAIALFIILAAVLGGLVLDSAGAGPFHRWLSRRK